MRPPGRRLWQTYALSVAALVTLVLVASGLAQLWLVQRETRNAVEALQALEAAKASARIDRFLGQTGALLRATVSLQDSRHLGDTDADIQVELYRLMRQSRAFQELYWIDPHGRERVRISRMAPDRIGGGEDRSRSLEFFGARAEAPWFGPVTFVGNQPRVVMARRGQLAESGVLVAEIELAQLRDIIDETRFGRDGYAYVVDGEGQLLAHPDFLQVLARPDWDERPPVRAAIAGTADHGGLIEFDAPEGRAMVARAAALSVPGWRLITEQPRDEAYAPIRRALATTLLILVLAVLVGSGVGIALARRVVRPIRQLAEGADRIGEGQLEHRIELARSDELGQLAARFNQMTERLSDSYRWLEMRVAHRTRPPRDQASGGDIPFPGVAQGQHPVKPPFRRQTQPIGQRGTEAAGDVRHPARPFLGREVRLGRQDVGSLQHLPRTGDDGLAVPQRC